jgi:hypothetical protein
MPLLTWLITLLYEQAFEQADCNAEQKLPQVDIQPILQQYAPTFTFDLFEMNILGLSSAESIVTPSYIDFVDVRRCIRERALVLQGEMTLNASKQSQDPKLYALCQRALDLLEAARHPMRSLRLNFRHDTDDITLLQFIKWWQSLHSWYAMYKIRHIKATLSVSNVTHVQQLQQVQQVQPYGSLVEVDLYIPPALDLYAMVHQNCASELCL